MDQGKRADKELVFTETECIQYCSGAKIGYSVASLFM